MGRMAPFHMQLALDGMWIQRARLEIVLARWNIKGRSDADWVPLNMEKMYRIVTNNYIAAGRDGYLSFKTVKDDGRF